MGKQGEREGRKYGGERWYITAGYEHTLEKPSKIKENRHSNTLKYAILYAKFFENP